MKTRVFKIFMCGFILLIGVAHAAEHEIGIGGSIMYKNADFENGVGICLNYDYSLSRRFTIRSGIQADFSGNKIYDEYYYSGRAELYGIEPISHLNHIISLEESILYKFNRGNYEPYIGFGGSFLIVSHVYYKYDDALVNTAFGLHVCCGYKYPMSDKLSTFIEAKYNFLNTDFTTMYTYDSPYPGIETAGRTDHTINLDKFQINAGLFFGL